MIPNPTPDRAAVGSPRWEWRTFSRHGLMRRIAAHVGSSTETISIETYLLSSRSPHSVRIHDNRIEVRELLEATVEGIERWQSILVSTFPLAPAVLHRVLATWHVEVSAELAAYPTLTAFIEAASAVPDLAVVAVEKRRRGFEFRHCRGEYAGLAIRGERWESIALKDEEVAIVRVAIEALGLTKFPSSNYPELLARAVGPGTAARHASAK
jgi:hypothetical protein